MSRLLAHGRTQLIEQYVRSWRKLTLPPSIIHCSCITLRALILQVRHLQQHAVADPGPRELGLGLASRRGITARFVELGQPEIGPAICRRPLERALELEWLRTATLLSSANTESGHDVTSSLLQEASANLKCPLIRHASRVIKRNLTGLCRKPGRKSRRAFLHGAFAAAPGAARRMIEEGGTNENDGYLIFRR
jgi:hypothetical protein